MAEQPSIDPRYDPAFQRGFDGAVATGSRTDVAARRAAPHVTSALQRPVGDRPAASPRESIDTIIGLPPEPVAAADAVAAPVVAAAPVPLRPPWTNPFAIVVTLVGVAVLAVGVWLLQEVTRITAGDGSLQSQTDYVLLQWGIYGAPIALALGAAILVAVLLFCAVYWGRRPMHEERD
jgi:hypothetical protein